MIDFIVRVSVSILQIIQLSSMVDGLVRWQKNGFIATLVEAYQSFVHPLITWLPFFPPFLFDYLLIGGIYAKSSYKAFCNTYGKPDDVGQVIFYGIWVTLVWPYKMCEQLIVIYRHLRSNSLDYIHPYTKGFWWQLVCTIGGFIFFLVRNYM